MESKRLKVLIVDDERTIATTLAMILEHEGYSAKTVFSGEDAIAASMEFTPDFLVIDVIMGGITGIEAAVEIRRICPGVRVIIVDGAFYLSSIVEQAEGLDFKMLTRPFPPETLLRLLAEDEWK